MYRHSKRGQSSEVEREVLITGLADLLAGIKAIIIIHIELSTEVGKDAE